VVYLYVHAIWTVLHREAALTKPVRRVLYAQLQKDAAERGIRVVGVGGTEDHIHCLLQLLPAQNLAQVLRVIRTASTEWLNGNKLLAADVEWEEGYAACSVSPSGVAAVLDYISRQEEVHQSKTLESELKTFEKFKESMI
jgi:REP element-mobilizing transposase RayT